MMRLAVLSAACLVLAAQAQASTGGTGIPAPGRHPDGWLRGVDPGTTGSVQAAPPAADKPACPPERRVGTGAGFCLIN